MTLATATPQWMSQYLDVHEPWEAWWLLVGLFAQALFFGRWVVQWIASERRRQSVIPVVFWWVSLAGASMLLIYYAGRREPVGVLSQLVGWTVYVRNLLLIRRAKASG